MYIKNTGLIQKLRGRYYLMRSVTAEEQQELLDFCTLDPVRQRWYCMSSKRLLRWVETHPTEGERAPESAKRRHPGRRLTPLARQHWAPEEVPLDRRFVSCCLAIFDWEAALSSEAANPTAIRRYQQDVRTWLQWVLETSEPLPQVPTEELIRNYISHLRRSGATEATLARVTKALTKYIKFLTTRNYTLVPPEN